jgi:hypothetical protein
MTRPAAYRAIPAGDEIRLTGELAAGRRGAVRQIAPGS